MINKRKLGNSGLEISECGLGCWQIGDAWGDIITENTSLKILKTAQEAGVNFYDTADVYGDGRSESLIGKFIKENQSDFEKPLIVATKYGRGGGVFPNNYSKETLRKSISDACIRLGVDSLDLLQLHCIPTEELKKGDVFDWLREVKEEGLIKNFGASVESIEEGLLCMEQDELASLQVIFNIFRQKLLDDLFPMAEKNNVGIIVRLPLASGLLSGKFDKDSKFDKSDHREFNKNGEMFNVGETFSGLEFQKGVELVDKLKVILKDYLDDGLSLSSLSLRWILDHPQVSSVIPGASSPDQVLDNVKASFLKPLPDSIHEKLNDFYSKEVESNIRGGY